MQTSFGSTKHHLVNTKIFQWFTETSLSISTQEMWRGERTVNTVTEENNLK